MSINNKIATLLEEKLWFVKECNPSDELTKTFMEVLSVSQESRQLIIKMRYGLNEKERKYTWQSILDEFNKTYPDYPCKIHNIREMERIFWRKINHSLIISDIDLACAKLGKLINNNENPQTLPSTSS